mgnify:CR=1 FL=1
MLFDELGTGTEPREGASLAVAILKYLRKKGATVILTTHFTEVKNYALNSDNSYFYSVDFDYDNLSPRYKLIKDVMGKSDPIMIAERLGFNREIIKDAEEELMLYKSSIEVQVEELNRMRAEAEHIKKILLYLSRNIISLTFISSIVTCFDLISSILDDVFFITFSISLFVSFSFWLASRLLFCKREYASSNNSISLELSFFCSS